MMVGYSAPVTAYDFNTDIQNGNYSITDDSVIYSGVTVNVDVLNIERSLELDNYGIFAGDVNVCAGCDFSVRNAGVMNADFNLGGLATVTQLVSEQSEAKDIGNIDDFMIYVDSDTLVSMRDILNISDGASKIVLDNAELSLDNMNTGNTVEIELRGNVAFYLNSLDNISPGVILSNVSGDGGFSLYTDNLTGLFTARTIREDDDVYILFERETDYIKVFDNETGVNLNKLRSMNPNNKLFQALDLARDMDSLVEIMGRSVHLNPVNLMDPIRKFNTFHSLQNKNHTGLLFGIERTASDDFSIYSLNLSFGIRSTERLSLFGDVYAVTLMSEDDVNKFDAQGYGGDLSLKYDTDSWRFNLLTGAAVTMFDVGTVYDGNSFTNNPDGILVYGNADIGYKINFGTGVSVVPFAGLTADYAMIVNDNDFMSDVYTGIDVDFAATTSNICYTYGMRLRGRMSGGLDASLRINAVSPDDGVGANIVAAIIYEDNTITYRLGLNGYIQF